MERSGNFYKAIRLGYILISILIGCMAYNSLYEWQEIEALELGNKKIDELRKEINNINIQMIKFSLLGETILEWNDKDIEHYHARRMAMDSMLCRFKVYEKKSMAASEKNPNIGLPNGFLLAKGAQIGAQIGMKCRLGVVCRPRPIFPPPPSRTIVHTFV